MKNIDQTTPFTSVIRKTPQGIITVLEAACGVAQHGSITCGSQSLLAHYCYDREGHYRLIYTLVDTEGCEKSFAEEEGILPNLFISPSGENYVSLVMHHPDKELEISLPVFHREEAVLPKGTRPFTGDFTGVCGRYALFYDVDHYSDTKPDRMLAVEFRDGQIIKKHQVKIPLPRRNKIFLEHEEIHLLALEEGQWLHRQIGTGGEIITQRVWPADRGFYREALHLSFGTDSFLLAQDEGQIIVDTISADGRCSSTILCDIGEPFYNTWPPVKISDHIYVTRFNTGSGNGWMTTRGNELMELFYSKGEKGYKNLLTGELLETGEDDLLISSVNHTTEKAYAVVFYPRREDDIQNKKIIVFNRDLSPRTK